MTRTSMLAVLALAPALAVAQPAPGGAPGPAGPGGLVERAREAARGAESAARDRQDAADAVLEEAAPAAPADDPLPDDALGLEAIEGSATTIDEGRGTVPAPDTYTVRPGDTLWDLSGRFLNNPWYWPKIWSYNPEIENPHWIYPGNLLRFYPGAEDAPGRVEPVAGGPGAPGPAEADGPDDFEVPRELEDLSRADFSQPASEEEKDAVAVAGPHKLGWVAPRGTLAARDTFVTERELAESGVITAAFEEKLLLSARDEAYARFKGEAPVKPGESYVIYKTDRLVRHPVTRELLGWQSVILGTARVARVDGDEATLFITSSHDPIERGAMLGPWTERIVRPVARRPNAVALEGHIVSGRLGILTQLGEHQLVFVDRGSADGVQEGNVFQVVRRGDLYGRDLQRPVWDEGMPKEVVGDLLVVDVRERLSSALVIRSRYEFMPGDRVEMQVDGAGSN
jgi:hypothetical protein